MILSFVVVLIILSKLSFCDERSSRVKRIVGGIPAEEPIPDDPTVFTNIAGRSARVQGVIDYPHYVFRGIKYAHAPVGKDRFLRSREKFLHGFVNATNFAPPCIQPRPGTNTVIGSEDCLALNVFTPELPLGAEGLPVVVWIHGGGFRYGSASQYGVRNLVGKRLVIVTIQYRLGSLGFLSAGSKVLPGNVALWDMMLAVQWVRKYIGFFGGNPYKITVMGHGTGASSALMVSLSKIAKGIISGVVAMSGTAVSNGAVDNTPQHTAEDIAQQNGCPTAPLTMVKCLQVLSAESIIRGDSNVEFTKLQDRGFVAGLSGKLGTAPVTEGINDGRSLPGLIQESALDEMDKGKHVGIPLLTGICKDETKRAIKGQLKQDVLNKIKSIPNFLNTTLVQNLKKVIPSQIQLNLKDIHKKFKENFQNGIDNLENIVSKLVPLNFQNYMKLKTGNILEALDKVADVTSDALFNVPAFLTVDKWSSKGTPTYLYSFDHIGKNQKGNIFLRGLPLVGNDTHTEELNDTVAHGDDLAYLFDAYDVEGGPLENEHQLTEEDMKVRAIFTQMIADFARFGAPRINNKPVMPFSSKLNNFIQIKSTPTFANNFKFCEMALWCNIAERLKSSACDFLKALDTSFRNMQNFVNKLKNQTNLTPDKVLQQLTLLANVSNQGINIFDQTKLINLSPDKVFKEINNKWQNLTNEISKIIQSKNNGSGLTIFGIDKKQENNAGLLNLFNKKQPNSYQEQKVSVLNNTSVLNIFGINKKQENTSGLPTIKNVSNQENKSQLFNGSNKNKNGNGRVSLNIIGKPTIRNKEKKASVADPASDILGFKNIGLGL